MEKKKNLSGWKSSGQKNEPGTSKYGPYLLGITVCDGNITHNLTHCRGPPTDKQTNKQRGRGGETSRCERRS